MNLTMVIVIDLVLYALSLYSTIFGLRTDRTRSLWHDTSSERDTALVINGMFLLLLALALMLHLRNASDLVVWPLVAFGVLLEPLFWIPNTLDKRWKYVMWGIAAFGVAVEGLVHLLR